MANRCSFCHKPHHSTALAQICSRCAVGRPADRWCDFCKKTTNTSFAYICDNCAQGRAGDAWCDFCKRTTSTAPAQICRKCTG